LLYLIYFKNIP